MAKKAKTKKLIYKGSAGFLEGVGYVKSGDEVTLDAERAKALLKMQPKQWDDYAAPDRKKRKVKKAQKTKKTESFRDGIVEKKGGKK